MVFFKKLRTTIQEARQQEQVAADIAKQAALLEYVAIMADVELPDASDEESEGLSHE